ncbi:hypothetical protein B1B_19103, partial [mine drainage metagenome]
EQSDGTSWMAMYCLNLWEISLVLARRDAVFEDMATKFFEHFAYIAAAMYSQGLWNDEDGFYYDVLSLESGETIPLRVRSLVGLLPLCATSTLDAETEHALPHFAYYMEWFLANKAYLADHVAHDHGTGGRPGRLFS